MQCINVHNGKGLRSGTIQLPSQGQRQRKEGGIGLNRLQKSQGNHMTTNLRGGSHNLHRYSSRVSKEWMLSSSSTVKKAQEEEDEDRQPFLLGFQGLHVQIPCVIEPVNQVRRSW